MDKICLSAILFGLLGCATNACINDSDCGLQGQYCCKSHCTSVKLSCSQICFRDQDCSRDQLCTQNVCVVCSKRYNCELKSCFNDTNCPSSLRCSKHMCTKKKPPKSSFTLTPFIIIIAVLGFALLVLCYTEGCWKEMLIYLKRYFGRYGRIARDEQEADRRDLRTEDERGSYHHSNKSCVDPQRIQTNIPNHSQTIHAPRTDSNSPSVLRNMRVVSHNNEIRTMTLPDNRPSLSRSPLNDVTSYTSPSCQQDSRVPNTVDTGSVQSLSDAHSITRNPAPLPPNYHSLFSEENELPPPKYEDVVNSRNTMPMSIEMQSIRPAIRIPLNHSQEIETTV